MKKRIVNKQKVFIFISAMFIVSCVIFYGIRFIYYYRKFNKKSDTGEAIELLYNKVITNNPTASAGDGLYNIGNEYIFKGVNVNNYVIYSGMTWRILKLNIDGSIYMISEDNVNDFMWGAKDSNYKTSNIRKWLNNTGENTGVMYNNLTNSQEFLVPGTICLDEVSNISNFKCDNKIVNDFIGLPSISDYTMTIVDDATFLVNTTEFWLSSMVDKENAWLIKKDKLSKASITDAYGIRPTITLASTVSYLKGDGTKENPYQVGDDNSLQIGKYVKLGDDEWIVYEVNNQYVRMALSGFYSDKKISAPFGNSSIFNPTQEGEIAYWLNNVYYNELSYKDLIVNNKWYIGLYNGNYEDIFSKTVDAKVGLLNISDIKLNNERENYYLLNGGSDNKVYAFDLSGYLFESSIKQNRYVKPAITINKKKIISGDGTKENPYILED